ncbi:unnamed protein product [Durusdinium trenchii]|uniref:Uncharacterized protein n=1 Tax=Durusdinium trenchii TaxID=1381693 RepID=A0ABP0PDJ4_9DINO
MATLEQIAAQGLSGPILEASKKQDKKLTLVDNRGLAKPSNFDGNLDFLQWKIRLEAFVESVHGDFVQAISWAEDETDPISNASMNAEFGETTPAQETMPDLESKDAQLYAVLQTLCEKEAFTLVRSAGKSKGLEAWRRSCKRFDPSTGGRRRALLRSVLSPNRCNKVEELSAVAENWDQVRQYENRRKVERRLQLNQARFADYLEAQKELSTYLETRIGLLKSGGGGHSSSDYNGHRRQEEKETCDRRDSREPWKGRLRSPKRGRSPKKKAKGESTDEEEERILRENKRRERSECTAESRKEFLKLADKTAYPKSALPRRARSAKAERRTRKGRVKAKAEAPDAKSDARPANSGFNSGCFEARWHRTCLSQKIEAEEDPDKKAEPQLEKQKKELQRDTPRQSIKITEENLRDQTFHDSRYYADVAAGKPRHVAWKNEKGRRRAILDRRSGLVDRVSEKLELDDNLWHSKQSAPGTGKKRKDLDGLKADVESEVLDDRATRQRRLSHWRMKAELSFMGRTPTGVRRFWKAGSQAFIAPWPRDEGGASPPHCARGPWRIADFAKDSQAGKYKKHGGPPLEDAPAASAGAPDEELGEEVGEEQAQVIVKRSPADPTAQEVQDHRAAGHVVHRSWCAHCQRARVMGPRHHRGQAAQDEEGRLPQVSLDYCYTNAWQERGSDSDSGMLPCLIVKCHKTGRYWGNVDPSKGTDIL